MTRLVRLSASASLRERRLQELLAGRTQGEAELQRVLEEPLVHGSVALAADAGDATAAAARLRVAWHAVPRETAFGREALLAWHAAIVPDGGAVRTRPRPREQGPPTAPPELIDERLDALAHWLSAPSARQLGPAQLGALALARLVEIAPFDDANGRVSRLVASHLMVRAGARPPLLAAGDAERLRACLTAAFQLATEPLSALLEEASDRCLDVMIRRLEG